MGVFEDFIQDELPLRQVVVKSAGDPTTGDGYIAAIGTYYLDTDNNFKRYEKIGSGNTDWREVPTTSSSGGVETEAVVFTTDSKISSIKIDDMASTQLIDSFDISDFTSAKYIIRASNDSMIHCSEILLAADSSQVYLTQYGSLGNSTAVTFNANITSNVVGLSGETALSGVDLSVCKILLS